jgi:hypothetical protein
VPLGSNIRVIEIGVEAGNINSQLSKIILFEIIKNKASGNNRIEKSHKMMLVRREMVMGSKV